MRAADLQRRIAIEWVRYVVIEMLLVFVPFIVVLVLWRVTKTISETAVIVFGAIGGLVIAALLVYTIKVRVAPLQQELEELERHDASRGGQVDTIENE